MKNKITFEQALTCLFIAITLAGIGVCLYMLFVPRSLCWDEAALSESIITRSFSELLSRQLDNLQTAPAGYLYIVKTFGAVFGYSETALRSPSFIAFIGVLLLQYLLMKKIYKINSLFTYAGICISATLSIFWLYATSIKPYMLEVFEIALILIIYEMYRRGKVKLYVLTAISIVMIFFSNSVLFFIAAIFIYELITSIKRLTPPRPSPQVEGDFGFSILVQSCNRLSPSPCGEGRGGVFRIFGCGALVLLVFGIYYFVWLQPMANSGLMQRFWEGCMIRIFPLSMSQLRINFWLIFHIFSEITDNKFVVVLIFASSVAGFAMALYKRHRITYITVIAFFLVFIASNLGKYPIFPRLNLYLYLFIIIYSTILFHSIYQKYGHKTSINIVSILALTLIFIMNVKPHGSNYLLLKYWGGQDNDRLIEYVENNIKEDEILYSCVTVNLMVKYKTNYSDVIGKSSSKILYGQNCFEWTGFAFDRTSESPETTFPWFVAWDNGVDGAYPNEIERVIEARKVYLIMLGYQYQHLNYEYGLDVLRQHGKLAKIMEVNDSHLYYFEATTEQDD